MSTGLVMTSRGAASDVSPAGNNDPSKIATNYRPGEAACLTQRASLQQMIGRVIRDRGASVGKLVEGKQLDAPDGR